MRNLRKPRPETLLIGAVLLIGMVVLISNHGKYFTQVAFCTITAILLTITLRANKSALFKIGTATALLGLCGASLEHTTRGDLWLQITGLTLLAIGITIDVFVFLDKRYYSERAQAPIKVPELPPDAKPTPIRPTRTLTDEELKLKAITNQFLEVDWVQFEKIIARIFEYDGWEVWRTDRTKSDGGADLFVNKDNLTLAVQAKFWNAPVSLRVMKEISGLNNLGIIPDKTAIYTWSDLNAEAAAYAKANGIIVVRQDEIVSKVFNYGITRFPELTNPHQKFCPKCDSPMRLHGDFLHLETWICSDREKTGCQGSLKTGTRFED